MLRLAFLMALFSACHSTSGWSATDPFGDEFIGPFATWLDAKRDCGAVGDGKADDTAALQKALDALRDVKTKSTALFLPAGTYRITQTLTLPRKGGRETIGLNIQGEDPATTSIVWDGADKGVMFDYGGWYSTLGRLTFNGANKAGIALRHGAEFVTANELKDMVFQDVGIGIEAGQMKTAGIAETSVVRCKFLRCSKAGFSCQNFNSLDWWFWNCTFEDCQIGATNAFGAGNFHVYESLFKHSKDSDLSIGNTGYLSFRHNTSFESKAFFVAAGIGAGAQLTFQDNTIIDSGDAQCLRVGNLGPVFLLDNVFSSRADVKAGPIAGGSNAEAFSVGNTFTVSDAVRFKADCIVLDDKVVERSALAPKLPEFPGTAPRSTAKIFEIHAGADSAAIQAAIDDAAKLNGQRPVIHLPNGNYPIKATLKIPAHCDLRLIGEGVPYVTKLEWAGAADGGPVIHVAGPTHAKLSNFVVSGKNQVDGVVIEGCDQPNGLVLFDQTCVNGAKDGAGWLFDRMEQASVLLRDCGHSGSSLGVKVVGGPNLKAGKVISGRTIILSGASSDNVLSYDMQDGGKLLARDIWYETGSKPRFLKFSGQGDFTLNGSNVAHPRKLADPGWEIDGFQGRLTLIGVCLSQVGGDKDAPAMAIKGESKAAKIALLGVHGNGEGLANTSSGAKVVRLNSTIYTDGGGAKAIPNVGAVEPDFLREMLAQSRVPHRLSDLVNAPEDAAQLVLHRLHVSNCKNCIWIKP